MLWASHGLLHFGSYLEGYALCRRPLLAPRGCHLEAWCLHFDIHILEDHVGTSGAPWGAIWAPPDHPGGPGEQQDGHGVVWNSIFIDFRMILGPVYISFLSSRSLKFHFVSGLFPCHFFDRFLNRYFDVGDSKIQVFARNILQTSTFQCHWNCFLWNSASNCLGFWGPKEPFFCSLYFEK